MKKSLALLTSIILTLNVMAQTPYGDQPLAHTYSIVAIDKATGEMGVAVQSHWFATGTLVTWGEAGVGVVATQSFVNPTFGPDGLALMRENKDIDQVLQALLAEDEGKEFRQLGLLNAAGKAASFTGTQCIDFAGHVVGNGYAVQANLMASDKVWPAMAEAFENSTGQALAHRLMVALEAAQAVGGDIRGKQSAALLVVGAKATGQPWVDRKVDLRVDDHPTPLLELKRLLKVHEAYNYMNKGDLAMEKGEVKAAMEAYSQAGNMFPNNLEMKFWKAINLANTGSMKEALPLFKTIFKQDENWKTLTPRLTKNGLLTVGARELALILQQ